MNTTDHNRHCSSEQTQKGYCLDCKLSMQRLGCEVSWQNIFFLCMHRRWCCTKTPSQTLNCCSICGGVDVKHTCTTLPNFPLRGYRCSLKQTVVFRSCPERCRLLCSNALRCVSFTGRQDGISGSKIDSWVQFWPVLCWCCLAHLLCREACSLQTGNSFSVWCDCDSFDL